MKGDLTAANRLERRLGERLHFHEPLPRDERLDDRFRAARDGHGVLVFLHTLEEPLRLKILDNLLTCLEPIHACIGTTVLVDRPVRIHDVDRLEIVLLADLKIVLVVRRRDFQRAGAEVGLDVLVRNDRNFAAQQREHGQLADEIAVAFVLGMHGDARIAQHRFRTCRGDRNMAGAVRQRIADVPEMPLPLHIVDLLIGERRHVYGAPVDEVVAAVDQSVVIKLDENVHHGAREAFVHRKALLRPVA